MDNVHAQCTYYDNDVFVTSYQNREPDIGEQ